MKKGINFWCFPNEWSLEKRVRAAKEAGFQGVELNVEKEGLLTVDTTMEQLRTINSLVKENNLEITSISSNLFWEYSLTSHDPKDREKAVHVIKRMIDFSSYLSVSTILVVPGLVTEQVSYDVAYNRSMETLREMVKYAEEKNVVIAIENVWNKFLLSPLEMKRFIEEINHPHVGVYFDVGNILNVGFPDQWIRILGSYIKKIHVKDFKTEIGNFHGFTSLLQGDVNWPKVKSALDHVGYDDYVTVEIMPPKHFIEESIHQASSGLQVILKGGLQ